MLSKFPEIIHGVSSRNYGDMRFGHLNEAEVIKNREHFCHDLGINLDQVVVAGLSHGTKIAIVDTDERGRGAFKSAEAIRKTDGLITKTKGIFLMVTIADCLPIFIYDPINRIIGIVHAGWRGIIGQIVVALINKLKELGSSPGDLVVGVGPGICQKHFVVKNDVLKEFRRLYPSATLVRNHDGYVDLKKAVLIDLNNAGVLKNNIEIDDTCPSCFPTRFGSFRKEGSGVPASASIIGLKE